MKVRVTENVMLTRPEVERILRDALQLPSGDKIVTITFDDKNLAAPQPVMFITVQRPEEEKTL